MSGNPASSVVFERQFQVAPDVVFDTLTEPELMPVWWGRDVDFDIDLRVGGTWTILRRDQGTEYRATGTYLEMDRPLRVKYTYEMPQFSPNTDIISVSIKPTDAGCTVIFEHAGPDIAEELAKLPKGETSASEAGWQLGFDLMQAAWAQDRQ